MMIETMYAIQEILTERYVSWITPSTGKIYYCKKPFTANYFDKEHYARNWAIENRLDLTKFKVKRVDYVTIKWHSKN